MKKLFVNIFTYIFLLVCSFSLLGCENVSKKTENQKTPIDMYLLAGQSNAVGCSEIEGNPTETFENIWYAGEIERYVKLKNSENDEPEYEISAAQSWIETFDDFKKYVGGGMGYHSTSIGPEYGMAKVLNKQYAGNEHRAIIFKTAYGGTFLHNVSTNANWASPSTWRAGYKPDPNKPISSLNMAGLLYQRFIDNFAHVYNELKMNGYQPVVKGMAWMQGEADASDEIAKMFYYRNLKMFINDIRADIVEITGDDALREMPFVIGKIAKTFGKYNNESAIAINEVQQAVADSEDMVNVYALDTDDLIIVDKDKINGSGGWDVNHYNFNDMITLGERFAKKFNEIEGKSGCTSNVNSSILMISLCLLVLVIVVVMSSFYKKVKLDSNK
jgi:hypothetical protein